MLKIIFVLVLFGAHNTCYGDASESDWRSRGWYRPRRNYPSQSQGQNEFEIKNAGSSLNYESQKPVTSFSQSQSSFGSASYNQRPQAQSQFGSFDQKFQSQNDRTRYNQSPEQNSFQNDRLNYQSASFGTSISQNYQSGNTLGARKSGSAQSRNTFGSSFSQNSRADYAQNTQNLNSFRFGYNQPQNQNTFRTAQSQSSFGNRNNQNAFGANFNQKPQNQNSFGNYRQNPQSHNAFGTTYNQNIQSPFGSAFAQNSLQYQNFTSNNLNVASSTFARGQSIFKGPDYLPPYDKPKPPYIAPGYLPSKDPTTTTRRPFYTTTTTTTRRPFYTTTTTRRPFYTTTTTRRPFFTTTTTTRPSIHTPNYSPPLAMAMRVLPEPEDDPTTLKPSTPFDEESSTLEDLKVTRPGQGGGAAMAMRVPPEPEDDPTTPKPSTPFDEESSTLDDLKVTRPGKVLPAMAMRVPPEPEDTDPPPTTTTTTTPPPSTTTTPPPTTTTTTTTPPPTTTTTTTPPPTTTTTTTPPPTTTTTTTTPPPTTTTTPPPTTTTTTTTPPPTTTTTTTTPPPTTTPTTTTTTTPPPPTRTTPTSTTTPDPNRMLIEETPTTTTTSTTTVPPPIPSINPYKAPEYLPPKNITLVPPKPAMATPVPPEPECDPLDPTTYPYPLGIDQRNSGEDPCTYVPIRTTTKKPFVGPAYLPPVVNARVGRSPKTLRLADVKGARPVWHVGLYTKTYAPYKQICGGSIVRMDVVITAAHCVWNDDTFLEPAENYAVGANKIYRPWTEPHDKRAQYSDIREIKVPPRFRGGKTSFQDDIAVLKLVTPFSYARGLRPVCVSFDDDFDTEQLSEGNGGTVAGWGYTDDVGSPTQYLLWLELPYVDIEKCIAGADDAFLKYITSDKICAGENHTGKALCKGDSGGGLVFWHGEGDLVTPYLRGVASASARADNKECNVNVVGGFTQVAAHRRFLTRHVPDIDQNCRYHYIN